MMAEMGIADAVKPKLTYMFAINGGATLVAKGEVEIGLFASARCSRPRV
jgi:hypothetical protein